ncbi:MAG TPA: hypothetical protein VEC16_02465 [Alphaproteobacteria bacterium]|nr:hypothetical protein [Alphaproteobacteria bacterium]
MEKRNIFYTGLAALSGIAGYLVGRSKSFRGVSLTLMAVSMMMYLPRGCDLIDTYMKNQNDMKIYKMKIEMRKDSLDNILTFEEMRKDSIYSMYSKMIDKNNAEIRKIVGEMRYEKNEAKRVYKDIREEMTEFKNCMSEYYVNQKDKWRGK